MEFSTVLLLSLESNAPGRRPHPLLQPQNQSYVSFYLLALMVALIYLYSQAVLLILATVYATSGILMKIVQMVKHKNEVIMPADQLFPSPDDTK